MAGDARKLGMEQLGVHFQELSALLTGPSGRPEPERLVSFAAAVVPHTEDCGLTMIRGSRRPATLARSGVLVDEVDRIQYEVGQGPCLDAVEGHDLVRADDLAAEDQWPAFGRRCAAETGVRSMFSVRLALSGDVRAALNFYARPAHAFDELDVGTGALVAPFAAMAVQSLAQSDEIENLTTALHSSRQIGVAVGILMTRRLLTREKAFEQLVLASQHLNRKLRDIAAEVALTGDLPAPPEQRRRRRDPRA